MERQSPGQRVKQVQDASGGTIFEVRGTHFPGFFLFFGTFFGGIPGLMLLLILFGKSSGEGLGLPGVLFMSCFVLVGSTVFFVGVFIMLGKTLVKIRPAQVSVERRLFGLRKEWLVPRDEGFTCDVQSAYESNDQPQYAVTFDSGAGKNVKVGSSLKEQDLIWLMDSVTEALGVESKSFAELQKKTSGAGLKELIAKQATDFRTGGAAVFSEYTGKTMNVVRQPNGWRMEQRAGGGFVMIFVALIFGGIGVMLHPTSREWVMELIPQLREAVQDIKTSGQPPAFFAFMFCAVGLISFCIAALSLGYLQVSSLESRTLTARRTWFGYGREISLQPEDVAEILSASSGEVNGQPRLSLQLKLVSGTKVRICSYRSPDEMQKIDGLLRVWLEREKSSTDDYAGSIPAG